MMHGREKSDPAIVAKKPANNAGQPAAERVERRAGTEGNAGQQSTRRAQDRESVSQALERVRQAANPLCRQTPEVGAGCGKSARPGPVRGASRNETSPTANATPHRSTGRPSAGSAPKQPLVPREKGQLPGTHYRSGGPFLRGMNHITQTGLAPTGGKRHLRGRHAVKRNIAL